MITGKGVATMTADQDKKPHSFHIQIDRVHYPIESKQMTGTQLRQLPTPPIGSERDLFEVVPGHPDNKVDDAETIAIHDGMRFFTAPAHINPGRVA
jgi:hypothetical protein